VSSGPFLLAQPILTPEDSSPSLTLQRNNYWPTDLTRDGNVQRVNFNRFDTLLTAYEQWNSNLLDMTPLPVSLSAQVLDSPNPAPPLVTSSEMFYLGFNFDSPLFSVPEVRRAFSAAIDRERLIDEVYGSRGLPMRHFAPPGILYALPIDQVGVGYSPDYARLQLVASGFNSCRLMGEIKYMISASDIALQHAEELIAMWVETLGCDARQFQIEQVQFGTLLANTRISSGDLRPDIFDLGWASFYPDAHDWFNTVLHCQNSDNRPKRPCDQADLWIDQAATNRSPTERAQLYRQVENAFFGEGGTYPVAPLYVRGEYRLTHGWIVRSVPATFGGEQYDTYLIDQDIKEIERSQ
jgi:ABC-type oligopeptide transport system substrate-binding subunit